MLVPFRVFIPRGTYPLSGRWPCLFLCFPPPSLSVLGVIRGTSSKIRSLDRLLDWFDSSFQSVSRGEGLSLVPYSVFAYSVGFFPPNFPAHSFHWFRFGPASGLIGGFAPAFLGRALLSVFDSGLNAGYGDWRVVSLRTNNLRCPLAGGPGYFWPLPCLPFRGSLYRAAFCALLSAYVCAEARCSWREKCRLG